MPPLAPIPKAAPLPERGAWAIFPNGWRQLYGSFPSLGFSIEYHDLRAAGPVDWAKSFHPHSLEICINLEGRGQLQAGGRSWEIGPAQFAVYAIGREPIIATRTSGQRHLFITIELSPAFLRQRLHRNIDSLLPIAARAVSSGIAATDVHPPRPFTSAQSATLRSLPNPPVAPAARGLWYEARLLEWLAECLFDEADELFCHRQQRLDRERVERVKAALTADLENAPPLADLARLVAISPFYLSRTFSRLTGETIPAYLRRTRIERAAELLRTGTHNVTEAAFAVGYSSLGHFSRNFTEVLGCPPTRYAAGGG
jgi:AraC-like DNA-binding protein